MYSLWLSTKQERDEHKFVVEQERDEHKFTAARNAA